MGAGNAFCDCKPKSCSAGFICNKRLEDVFHVLRRDSASVVDDFDAYGRREMAALAGLNDFQAYFGLSGILLQRSVPGILQQVQYGLSHFYSVAADFRESWSDAGSEFYPGIGYGYCEREGYRPEK